MTTTLYTNGLLYLGGGVARAGHLLVDGERIRRVLAAEAPAPSADEVVDLEGGTLLPGFQDAHVHPVLAGLQLLGIDLTPAHSRQEYLHLVEQFARAHPDTAVLRGGGWFGDVFPGGFPSVADLDAVVADRPVVLYSHDAHGVWVNSAALAAAGIDARTPDPDGGRIFRDSGGAPTGMLVEAAVGLVTPLLPEPDAETLVAALLAAQRRLHSVGVTTWQDAAVGASDIGPDALPAYEEAASRGLLTARVIAALWWDRERGLEQIEDLCATRDRLARGGRIDGGTVKVMVDGMVENRTAAMLDPFEGHSHDRGVQFIPQEDLDELSVALDAAGFQIHFHAVGDGAVRSCLDALAIVRQRRGASPHRHHIAHLDIVDDADIPRFAELDASANVTAIWARRDEEIVTRKLALLGRHREHRHFPFAAIAGAGGRIVGGSDWPVTDPNPLWSVRTAVTRTGVPEDPHAIGDDVFTTPLLAEQALSLGTALDAYLSAAAWINRCEHVTGALREGLLADLVWIDRDVRDVAGLGAARVRRTVVSGHVVYEAGSVTRP
ncbi:MULTISPECIES: amidohydrolase [Microbacterium]|uniref:amidohydrolase n=1 Tax=Microbacterium TaxID=33882 RepID=UPI0027864223|nr:MULTISPECIES: amidohydrolase [Microbacterium]MDQ1074923.1 putative amidohydrolase YtcJ [Microbacterium sp. SORGH_AS_0969]MDQ1115148.1 putative amidohydrolase YtcJ [Microbacterium testaceum]